MSPLLAFILGMLLGLAVASGLCFLGYRLAQLHERQTAEFNALTSRDGP